MAGTRKDPTEALRVWASLILAASLCAVLLRSARRGPDEEMRLQGDRLLVVMQEHVRKHGVPKSLEEAGVTPPVSELGEWRYMSGSWWDPDYWAIMIGDYNRDGFVYYWSSQTERWHVDN
jgi:hypothetical protein